MKIILDWLIRWRWWLIWLILFIIINMQLAELLYPVPKYYHLIEFFIYFTILLIGGVFLELQLRGSATQSRTLRILDYKHQLSLALTASDDWDVMAFELAKFPGSVSRTQSSCLFIRDTISGQFEHAAHWQKNGEMQIDYHVEEARHTWVDEIYTAGLLFHRCPSVLVANQAELAPVEYCLPIKQADHLLAFLRFQLVLGEVMSKEEEEIFSNVGDELALALKAGQARKTSFEMHTSETALAERRTVSHYLHDSLGQNLGYLRMKLDQLLSEKDLLSVEQIQDDLKRMRDAASESYDFVRGTLETIHPKTLPHLMNVLQEHARKVAERAHYIVNFEVRGRPIPLRDDVQSAIFYVCHEVLNNVEKHSKANCVDIFADWGDEILKLSISDNGIGFNPQTVNPNQHFGLEIVEERINNINGRITLKTSENSGTIIVLSVPIHPIVHL